MYERLNVYCRHCGTENSSESRFCKSCGKPLDFSTVETPTRQRNNVWKIITVLGMLSVLGVLGVLGTFLLLRDNIIVAQGLSENALDSMQISNKLYYSIPANEHIVEDAASAVVFVDNEAIVYLSEGRTLKDAESIAEQYGGEIVGLSAYTNSFQLRFDQAYTYEELNQLIGELEADTRVEAVSKNIGTEISCDERTSDPVWSGASKQYWGLMAINAPEAWDIVQAGPDVRVGIMDTQFYTEHEDLSGAFAESMPSYETSFNAKENGDAGKHGTHVAGIIGARANNVGTVGVAPGTTMYGYSAISNMVNRSGKQMITLSYGFEVGWTYLIAENGCRVVNMSLGADDLQLKNSINSASVIPKERQQLIEESNSCANSIRALVRAGYDDFVICKSAGNSGERGGLADYDFLGYIADEEVKSRIIVVGSVEGSDGRTSVSRFSCGGHRVDIVAPGEDIYSTYYDYTTSLFGKVSAQGTYSYLSGTSMATPMVAGTAALVIAANPDLKGDQIKQVICESAEQGGYAVDHLYFVGLLDAEAAVKQAQSFKDDDSEASDSQRGGEGASETIGDVDGEESGSTESKNYILSGIVRTHEESIYDHVISVVSITLDAPINYNYDDGGTKGVSVNEVELSNSVSNDYDSWVKYDDWWIMVRCDGLECAIRDGSMHGVDAFAAGNKEVIRTEAGTKAEGPSLGESAALTLEEACIQVEKLSKAPVVSTFVTDFNNDGANDAYILTGSAWGSSFANGGEVWSDVELWFVYALGDVARVVSFDCGVYANGVFADPQGSGYQFLSLETTAGGSGSSSRVFTVQDSHPIELEVGGRCVQEHDGRIIEAKSVFDEGHKLDWYELQFDESEFRINEGPFIARTELFELP